jgi:hypothetical protein
VSRPRFQFFLLFAHTQLPELLTSLTNLALADFLGLWRQLFSDACELYSTRLLQPILQIGCTLRLEASTMIKPAAALRAMRIPTEIDREEIFSSQSSHSAVLSPSACNRAGFLENFPKCRLIP